MEIALLFISAAAWHSPLPLVGHTSQCFTCPFPHPEAALKLQYDPVEMLQPPLPFSLWHTITTKDCDVAWGAGAWIEIRPSTLKPIVKKGKIVPSKAQSHRVWKRSTILGSTHLSTRTDKSFATVLLWVLSFGSNCWLSENFLRHLTPMDH